MPAATQHPVQVTMQPLQPGRVPPSQQQAAAGPLPLRWAEALKNVEAAQKGVEELSRQLDSALYLDEEAWQQAVPHAQFTAALHGQQRKIAELEAQLAAVVVRLEESERARRAAEERVRELSSEVEGHGNVFKLHYEELMRKDQEIHDLQAVIQALSLGSSGQHGTAAGGGSTGRGGGSSLGGSTAGASDDEGP